MSSPPSNDSGETAQPQVTSGGTVRAWNPLTTPEGQPRQEQTVRARVPTPPPVDVPMAPLGSRSTTAPAPAAEAADAAEPVPELDFEELIAEVEAEEAVEAVEAVEVEMLEPTPMGGDDVPVSRYDAPTLKEKAADISPEFDILRDEPPAVAGEVSVVEPEPYGMFDPRPRGLRPSTEPAQQASPTRADPAPVAGEMSVAATTEPPPPSTGGARVRTAPQAVVRQDSMSASGPQPVLQPDPMTSSGSQPALQLDPMNASGPQPVLRPDYMSASGPQPVLQPQPSQGDPSNYVGGVYSETTGPQPVAQAEITVPHQVMRVGPRPRPDRTLWYVALALVVLAVGGVLLVVSRAS